MPRMTVQELKKQLSQVIKHDELLTCCVVIGDLNISEMSSNTLADYLNQFC